MPGRRERAPRGLSNIGDARAASPSLPRLRTPAAQDVKEKANTAPTVWTAQSGSTEDSAPTGPSKTASGRASAGANSTVQATVSSTGGRHSAPTGIVDPLSLVDEGPRLDSAAGKIFTMSKRKQELAKRRRFQVMWRKAQSRFLERVQSKYTNLTDVFRSFDADKDGCITFTEFDNRMQRLFGPAQYDRMEAVILFNSVRPENEHVLSFRDMQGLFMPEPPISAEVRSANDELLEEEHPKTSEARIAQIKTKLIEKVQQRQKRTKSYRQDSKYLLEAFRAFDTNNNGLLSYEEFRRALGPAHLNLGIPDQEIYDLCIHTDKDDAGMISYANFINTLAVVDIDKNYDPISQGRALQIEALTRIVNHGLNLNSETPADAAWAPSAEAEDTQSDEQLPETASPELMVPIDPLRASVLLSPITRPTVSVTWDAPPARETLAGTASMRALLKSRSAHDVAFEPNATTSPDRLSVFKEMARSQTPVTRLGCRPDMPETGHRVGVGGDGPVRDSPFYLDEKDRFNTTSSSLLSLDSDVVNRVSDSRLSHQHRERRREIRTAVLTGHLDRLAASLQQQEDAKRMAEEVRLRTKSRQRLRYCGVLEEKERALQVRTAGVARFHRKFHEMSDSWFAHSP